LAGPVRLLCAAWLLVSYLAWSLVSNKDERYFLPAAAALPVLGTAGLPAPALGLAGALAVFHARGIRRPEPEDWRSRDILEALREFRRPEGPTMLCVLANHARLNATSLTWLARRARIEGLSVGCVESEIPEWADLVLLKTGDPGVFLADKTRAILARAASGQGLFHKAFREARRWPLPDGSEAVLYEVRRDVPLLKRAIRLGELRIRSSRLQGVRLRPTGPESYEAEAETLTLSKISAPVRGLRASLEGARILEDHGRLYVLGMDRVRIMSAEVDWEDLSKALSERSGLPMSVALEEGEVSLGVRLGPLPMSVSLSVAVEGPSLDVRLRRARLAGVPLPVGGLGLRRSLEADPPKQPYGLELAGLRLQQSGLRVGGSRP
jgi:hypothetical protein